MPVRVIPVGQTVFIIEKYQVMEATITRFLNQKDVIVTSERLYFATKKKSYGKDFFFTREKAEKFLDEQARQRQENRKNEETSQFVRRAICEACGLPIGGSSHCGCSY